MTEQSNHSLTESLSALADGEATPLEVRRLLKASETDPQLGARWARYNLAGAAMRRDVSVMAPEGFAAGLSEAIANEPSARASGSGWWQHLGRAAVAASVAGAVLLGVQQYPAGPAGGEVASSQGGSETSSEPVSLPAGHNSPIQPTARTVSAQSGYEPAPRRSKDVVFIPVQSGTVQVPAEEVRAYLNQLMQEHSDNAARNSNQGVLPYARVPSDADEQGN
ncbi:sigma-E factor negative regulatory protein [Marinimicrobium sp. C2-29]|uniref:sigma-E factor negative regulatory protein n=1 Tax=Marinimicrobium sp. C2-29 TaxID=3139825 RepID=UPI003139FA6D